MNDRRILDYDVEAINAIVFYSIDSQRGKRIFRRRRMTNYITREANFGYVEKELKVPAANWENYIEKQKLAEVVRSLAKDLCGLAGERAAQAGLVQPILTSPPKEGSEAYQAQVRETKLVTGAIKIALLIAAPLDGRDYAQNDGVDATREAAELLAAAAVGTRTADTLREGRASGEESEGVAELPKV